ncbi:FAD dependent oxidoreductase [Wallemia mellicola]|nr:FAD dependent oxidoreductase [Wallemia mellicola]TIC05655.1 FAD dependent oxidoreductase [Wallemia mellicola]
MKNILIVGAGIVGVSTAFYLSESDDINITLIDSSGLASGASGKAGGFIAADWNALSQLSWRIHQELAEKFNGYQTWGYRRVTALNLTAEIGHRKCPQFEHKKFGTNWVDPNVIVSSCDLLGSPNNCAQVTPKPLVEILFQNSKANLVKAHLKSIIRSTDNDNRPRAVIVTDGEKDWEIVCDDVVFATGPWTGNVAQSVLSKDEANVTRVGGQRIHSLILRPPTQLEMSAHCLFVQLLIRGHAPSEPEFFARPDGTAFICGSADEEPIPSKANQVKIDSNSITELKKAASSISPQHFSTFEGSLTEVIAEQACYMPIPTGSSSNPLIGTISPGIHVGAGHSVWGILLGPGTGKVLAEIITQGKAISADISRLTPDAIKNPKPQNDLCL